MSNKPANALLVVLTVLGAAVTVAAAQILICLACMLDEILFH